MVADVLEPKRRQTISNHHADSSIIWGINQLTKCIILRNIHITLQPITLQWCHNECDGISNHQPHDCLLNRSFRRRSKKTSKLCVTGLCEGNSPVIPAQRASNAKKVSISWRHHERKMLESGREVTTRRFLVTGKTITPYVMKVIDIYWIHLTSSPARPPSIPWFLIPTWPWHHAN